MLIVRPKVTELLFQVYGRAVHPELFKVHQSRTIERADYSITVDITNAGHVATWRHDGLTLTEVASAANHPLPEKRRMMKWRLHGKQKDRLDCRGGVTYEVAFQLEPVEPAFFWAFQEQLTADVSEHSMLQRFDSSGRMALGAISYINIESRQRRVTVKSFHTFPDDYAIVKVQSQFRLP
ncbi:MAG: DUF2617 family protein [Planctomycetales bacterium]|nr:DUF2617 family protein [Planctomycetales bacterium]